MLLSPLRLKSKTSSRAKGAWGFHKNYDPDHYQDNILLEQKLCKDKQEALERACKVFAIRLYEKRFNKRYHVRVENKKTKDSEYVASKEFLAFHEKIVKPEFQRLLELGDVTVVADNRAVGRFFTVKVINHSKKELGKISQFRFPKNFLERNIVKTHEMGLDECHLLWEHALHEKATRYNSASEFIEKELFNKTYWKSAKKIFDVGYNGYNKINWNKFRDILAPFGVIGYEYPGGSISGGSNHRAFNVWDDDFVNKHRVG